MNQPPAPATIHRGGLYGQFSLWGDIGDIMLGKIIRNAVIFLFCLFILLFAVVYITDREYALDFVEAIESNFYQ